MPTGITHLYVWGNGQNGPGSYEIKVYLVYLANVYGFLWNIPLARRITKKGWEAGGVGRGQAQSKIKFHPYLHQLDLKSRMTDNKSR